MGIDIAVAATLFAVAWVLALEFLGLYQLRVRWRLITEAKDIARATLLVLAATLSTLFIFHLDNVSRLFLALLFVALPVVTLAGRFRSASFLRDATNPRLQHSIHACCWHRQTRPELRRPG